MKASIGFFKGGLVIINIIAADESEKNQLIQLEDFFMKDDQLFKKVQFGI